MKGEFGMLISPEIFANRKIPENPEHRSFISSRAAAVDTAWQYRKNAIANGNRDVAKYAAEAEVEAIQGKWERMTEFLLAMSIALVRTEQFIEDDDYAAEVRQDLANLNYLANSLQPKIIVLEDIRNLRKIS